MEMGGLMNFGCQIINQLCVVCFAVQTLYYGAFQYKDKLNIVKSEATYC